MKNFHYPGVCRIGGLIFSAVAAVVLSAGLETSTVWFAGEGGYERHFVYGLVQAKNGPVLVFCEARTETADDGAHDLVMKSSADGGHTWSETMMIETGGGRSLANPTPVVDAASGRITLFYADNSANRSSRVYFKTSENNGVSWSKATEVTGLFARDPEARPFHLPGPGHGIQLADGRLVLQVWHRQAVSLPAAERQYGVSVITSDDGGRTWLTGGYIAAGYGMNESRVVELNNGRLMVNARITGTAHTTKRAVAISADRGATWEMPQVQAPVGDYVVVDSGFLKYDAQRFLFSRPDSLSARANLTVAVSHQSEASSYTAQRLIQAGKTDYSDLVRLTDGRVGVVYGHGATVAFSTFEIEWLEAGGVLPKSSPTTAEKNNP